MPELCARERAVVRHLVRSQLDLEPRDLGLVVAADARRCALLGLDRPVKVAPTDPAGEGQYEGGGLAALLGIALLSLAWAELHDLDPDGSEGSILIVEDDDDIRALMRHLDTVEMVMAFETEFTFTSNSP